MFQRLGTTVRRFWYVLIACWVGLLVTLLLIAPPWDDVIQDGEFSFLPEEVESRQGERLFKEAFPNDLLASSVVIVVRRESPPDGLLEDDRRFITDVLEPALLEIAEEEGGLAVEDEQNEDAEEPAEEEEPVESPPSESAETEDGTPAIELAETDVGQCTAEKSIIARIRTFDDAQVGRFLDSPDGKASLVIVDLTTEFQERRNRSTIKRIEELLGELSDPPAPVVETANKLQDVVSRLLEGDLEFDPAIGESARLVEELAHALASDPKTAARLTQLIDQLRQQSEPDEAALEEIQSLARRLAGVPEGLDLAMSGSATVGRDMRLAAEKSADATEMWTVILVLCLLVIIYRAPILSLIPLATVATAVAISLCSLALLAERGIVELFAGIEIYVTVLVYGAGVDYCLFLIARYKEELDEGVEAGHAIANALGKVGAALTASAGTVMCGIGMMVFAKFGKFQQAGVAITLSLAVCLLAALTLTPSLLRLTGRWAFWPEFRSARGTAGGGWFSALTERLAFESLWRRVGGALLRRPATIWLASVLLMVPFAIVGIKYYNHLTYGLLAELPRTDPSVVGAKAVQEHFPAGATGIITLLIRHDELDFGSRTGGAQAVEQLTVRLNELKQDLRLASIRSVSHPLGDEESILKSEGLSLRNTAAFKRARRFYVSDAERWDGRVTRIDLISEDDPFSRDSISHFQHLKSVVQQNRPQELTDAEFLYIGPTASIRDLKLTTDRDQIVIDFLVLGGVFAILVVLLRRPAISTYLIVSVFFSYLVTLGVAFVVFWALDPSGFPGLDWKVPMFLFTILIAVGEDYNIFLMTRIQEEQAVHGPVKGVIVALEKTGGIISSCGFIMAGTFSSLLAGSLVGMHQLGFALAFGVLLDTFVVRPILVPAYLILLYSGRFGAVGKLLGAGERAEEQEPARVPASPTS